MSNNKERYLVFAHTGVDFIQQHLVELKVEKACGTTLSNGLHLTHLQLHKNNGKRASAAGKVVEHYNELVGDASKHINVAKFPGCNTDGVVCVKRETMASNLIFARIMSDVGSSVAASWMWPVGAFVTNVVESNVIGSKRTKISNEGGGVSSGSEKLVINSKLVCAVLAQLGFGDDRMDGGKISSSAVEISNRFKIAYGASSKFGNEHREFLIGQVRSLFSSELGYVCEPLSKFQNAAAIILPDIVGEVQVEKAMLPGVIPTASSLNSITREFFEGYQLHHAADMTTTSNLHAKEFVRFLNKGAYGTYRSVCVESFMLPLLVAGVVTRCGDKRPCRLFGVDHARLAMFLLS